MNKILAYTVIAILLGTVTMVAPLALLGPSDPNQEGKFIVTVPEATEPSDQERASENGGTLESGDLPNEMWTKPEPSEPSSQEYVMTCGTVEKPSDLSPIGLMTIPSFLVALGVFVYLKKRMA